MHEIKDSCRNILSDGMSVIGFAIGMIMHSPNLNGNNIFQSFFIVSLLSNSGCILMHPEIFAQDPDLPLKHATQLFFGVVVGYVASKAMKYFQDMRVAGPRTEVRNPVASDQNPIVRR